MFSLVFTSGAFLSHEKITIVTSEYVEKFKQLETAITIQNYTHE
jgi:hypothetical protein